MKIQRVPFMLAAGLSLLVGLTAAWLLLGLPLPGFDGGGSGALSSVGRRFTLIHGPLMVLGFVGTLICLERACAWGRGAGFGAPALLGAGTILLAVPAVPLRAAQTALLLGTLAFALLYVPLWRRRPDDATLVQALGAVAASFAAALWLGGLDVPRLMPWLLTFLVLTIVGERLELARISIPPATELLVLVLSSMLLIAAGAALLWPRLSWVFGLALGALAAVMLTADVARRTARADGQRAFSGRLMLAGYGWLLVAAGVWLASPGTPRGYAYDAAIHAVVLGFVMSMVFAHAPTILPAVLRIHLPYRPAMYVPAALLHLSLAVRLLADAAGDRRGWQVGGVIGIVALLSFVAVAVTVAAGGRRTGIEERGAR